MATKWTQHWETVTTAIKDLAEQRGGLKDQIKELNNNIGEQSNIIVTQNTTIAKLSAKIALEGTEGRSTSDPDALPAPLADNNLTTSETPKYHSTGRQTGKNGKGKEN